jgi:hypothetical protein
VQPGRARAVRITRGGRNAAPDATRTTAQQAESAEFRRRARLRLASR